MADTNEKDIYREWFIYHLLDPRPGVALFKDEPRYVGISVRPKARLCQHIYEASNWPKNRKTYKVNWIRQVLAAGLEPLVVVVSSGYGPSCDCAERMEIALQKSRGARLTNGKEGGENKSGWVCTQDARDNLQAGRQKWYRDHPERVLRSEESIDRMRQAWQRRKTKAPRSQEWKDKQRIGALRAIEERRLKLAEEKEWERRWGIAEVPLPWV